MIYRIVQKADDSYCLQIKNGWWDFTGWSDYCHFDSLEEAIRDWHRIIERKKRKKIVKIFTEEELQQKTHTCEYSGITFPVKDK